MPSARRARKDPRRRKDPRPQDARVHKDRAVRDDRAARSAATGRRTPSARARRASLNLVLTVGIIDGLLLLVLLYVAFVDRNDAAVSVIGPIHGLGYVYLLYLTATGATRGMWGWWFPGVVLVTGGPLGSILGEMRLRRDL